MAELKRLSEADAIDQIVQTVHDGEAGAAPFALVLGSGFSHGLVPTARELVGESLPLWMKSGHLQSLEGEKLDPDQRNEIARKFWSGFVDGNKQRNLALALNPQTGLPESYSDAYRAVFDPRFKGAVGAPARARKFQRALMRLDKPRLNAAHFLLASLLGVQPGRSRPSDLFNSDAAFSRLILTTNFDPFLQTALQAVNRLYFMSDTPELGVGDEIFDDQIDAIHLVYLHGTIHRRSQAATDASIQALKEKNADRLAPVLKRHGVIVLGYSGWDDAIVEALSACEDFDHLLYWCGLEADPLAKGAFGPRVAEILEKPTAFYVRTTGAGRFMAQIVNRLVKGIPRLLDNPIAQLRDMLTTIDLRELKNLRPVERPASNAGASDTPSTAPISDSAANTEVFLEAQDRTLRRLQELELVFRSQPVPQATETRTATSTPAEKREDDSRTPPPAGSERIQQLLSSARVAEALGNYDEALKLCDEALALHPPEPADLAKILLLQGEAFYFIQDFAKAISSWTRIADWPDAPTEELTSALVNRGIIWGHQGKLTNAIADYTRVIENLPDAPVEQRALALVNRGFSLDQKGEIEKALADYTAVIENLPGVSVELLAWALRNRGVSWGEKGETEKAIADLTRLIEQLPGAPLGQVALALINRGFRFDEAGDSEKALADYTRVIDQLPGAQVEHIAMALRNRGLSLDRSGETEKALADYTRLIALPGAPVEHVANAYANRGWMKYLKNDFTGFLADTELARQTLSSLGFSAFNLGLALLACGRDAEALTTYRSAAEKFPESIETVGMADLEDAKKRGWLTHERAKPAVDLLQSLKK